MTARASLDDFLYTLFTGQDRQAQLLNDDVDSQPRISISDTASKASGSPYSCVQHLTVYFPRLQSLSQYCQLKKSLSDEMLRLWQAKRNGTPSDWYRHPLYAVLTFISPLTSIDIEGEATIIPLFLVNVITTWTPRLRIFHYTSDNFSIFALWKLLEGCKYLQEIKIGGFESHYDPAVGWLGDPEERLIMLGSEFLHHPQLRRFIVDGDAVECAESIFAVQDMLQRAGNISTGNGVQMPLQELILHDCKVDYQTIITFLSSPASVNLKRVELKMPFTYVKPEFDFDLPTDEWISECIATRHISYASMPADLHLDIGSPNTPHDSLFKVIGHRIRSLQFALVHFDNPEWMGIEVFVAILRGQLPYLADLVVNNYCEEDCVSYLDYKENLERIIGRYVHPMQLTIEQFYQVST